MKNIPLLILFLYFSSNKVFSQSTLFDETRVSSVYIEISPDSLEVIMTDVLSDHYFKALFIYDFGTGRDTLQDVGFRLRGNTSRFSQKKSFKISFNEYEPGRRYQEVKKINLNGQHNDPTLVREKLFYDSWKNAGLAERRTSFVRMYINQVYYGLYSNLEEFDKDWLDRVYGDKSGNLYKCTYPADLVYHGTNQQTYKNIQSSSYTDGRAYDLQTNETADDYSDLVDLITLLDKPADSLFAVQIETKINIDGLLKAFALDVASGNWDDYMYNMNNYFLYHRTDTDKFEFITYDTDNTFGVDWVNRDWATRDCLDWISHSQSRPLAEKILSVPQFRSKYQQYLNTITQTITNPDIIFPYIDSMETLITGPAIEDTFRSLDYGYSVADFHNGFVQSIDYHTPYGVKPFLALRYTSTLQQLETASVPGNIAVTLPVYIFPNPADDFITIKAQQADIDRQFVIVDIMGRKQKSFLLMRNQSQIMISVTDLAKGVYSLIVQNKGHYFSSRFVIK